MKKICASDICLFKPIPTVKDELPLEPIFIYVLKSFPLFRRAMVLPLNEDMDFISTKSYIIHMKYLYPLNNPFLPNIIVRYRPDIPTFSDDDAKFMDWLVANNSLDKDQNKILKSICTKVNFFSKGKDQV